MYCMDDDGLQNMFVYQATFSKLQVEKDKGIDCVIIWKSKGLYSSTLFTQYTRFVHSIKSFGYKIGIKLDEDPLVVEQNSYVTKIVNADTVYGLDTLPKIRMTILH